MSRDGGKPVESSAFAPVSFDLTDLGGPAEFPIFTVSGTVIGSAEDSYVYLHRFSHHRNTSSTNQLDFGIAPPSARRIENPGRQSVEVST